MENYRIELDERGVSYMLAVRASNGIWTHLRCFNSYREALRYSVGNHHG